MSTRRDRGFSLVEMLVIGAIVVVLAAVAVARLWPAQQFAAQDAAVTSMRGALDDAVSRAEAGRTVTFSAESVPLPAGVFVNSPDFTAPEGTTTVAQFDLQGGRGTPLVVADKDVGLRPTAVAVVLSDDARTWATALVLNTAGIVTRYDWRERQWEKN